MTMDWKIGEIRQVNGEWYQCVENGQGTCEGCSLIGGAYPNLCNANHENSPFGYCGSGREDNKYCMFKKLKKMGEPYWIGDKLIQRYKIYPTTYCINVHCWHYEDLDIRAWTIDIEIKQNKDMEETIDNYDGNMDKECIHICDALNSIPDVRTTESCCGHCKDRFRIFFTCDNPHSLAIIARVFDRRYIGTSQPWYVELQTKDDGAYDYFIHSETKYDSEEVMMKDVNQIIENIEHWCDDKFASHFKGSDGKPTFAPFDINLAKAGKPVRTRDGRKVRIVCFDQHDIAPIVGLVTGLDGKESIYAFYEDGRVSSQEERAEDLVMSSEKKYGRTNI